MDRIVQIAAWFILLELGLGMSTYQVNALWSLNVAAPVSNTQAQSAIGNAQGFAGCTVTNGNPNCSQDTNGLTAQGSSFFGDVLFIGDWLFAIGSFVTNMIGVLVLGQFLHTTFGLPDLASSGSIGVPDLVDAMNFLLWGYFVVVLLRGSRVS